MGFVHSLGKRMVPMCKQKGYPEVETIWYMKKYGPKQKKTEEDKTCRGELPLPPQ